MRVQANEPSPGRPSRVTIPLSHLQRLESESIHILREVVAEAEKPVMLYSVGKDSAVMLHLARKALFPASARTSAVWLELQRSGWFEGGAAGKGP